MPLIKIKKGLVRLKQREFGYLAKRLFPGGNFLFYAGRQLVFQLTDKDSFRSRCEKICQCNDYSAVLADKEDINKLCLEFPLKALAFKKRVANGDSCYIAQKDGVICAYVWVREAQRYFDTNSLMRFELDKVDGVWFNDVYVKSECRRQGLFTLLLSAVYKDCMAKGYDTLYSETYHTNSVSIASHKKLGCTVILDVKYISILGLKIYFVNNLKKGDWNIQTRYTLGVKQHQL